MEGRSYATIGDPADVGMAPLITLHARFWGFVPGGHQPVKLLNAYLDPIVDGKPGERLVSQVAECLEDDPWPVPDDITYPTEVLAGQTLNLEAIFHVKAQTMAEAHPGTGRRYTWPTWIYAQPYSVKGTLTLVDQAGQPHKAEVVFRGTTYVKD